MTNIESKEVNVAHSDEKIFNYFTNLQNFGKLMPAEVTDWSANETECSFSIKGMPKIGFKINHKEPFTLIKYEGTGKLPASVFLQMQIRKNNDSSAVRLNLLADLNPMLKMMFEKPLTKFLDVLVENLSNLQF